MLGAPEGPLAALGVTARAKRGIPFVALAFAACASIPNAFSTGRGDAIKAPAVDRCDKQPDELVHAGCLRARDKAAVFLRALHTEDSLCLEPMLGDDLGNCRARATVEDQDPTAMLLLLIDVDPSSQWTDLATKKKWFENAALVDFYLREKGF